VLEKRAYASRSCAEFLIPGGLAPLLRRSDSQNDVRGRPGGARDGI